MVREVTMLESELLESQHCPFLREQCVRHFDKPDIQGAAKTRFQDLLA